MMPYKDLEERKKNHTRYMREVWYPKNKSLHIELVRKARNRRRTELRKWLYEFKQENGCYDCGIKDYRVLEFDHLRDKKFIISVGVGTRTKTELLEEIKKCDVICSNCHRIRTWERRAAGKSKSETTAS